MYTVKFDDGELFLGCNPEDSNWNHMPNKPIAELHYEFLGKKITLKGYEAYNHLIKYVFMIDSQQQIISAILIMAQTNNIVKRFIFDLIKNQLIVDEVPVNQEYNNKPASGWKVGILGCIPEVKIV